MNDNYDFSMVQGDSYQWIMTFISGDGTPYNLAGSTLSMQVRNGYYPTSIIASYQTYIPAGTTYAQMPNGLIGGICGTATGGTIYVSLGSTYSANFFGGSTPKYDIQLQTSGNIKNTLVRGTIEVLNEVTR
jgi:hypothetical protein